MPQAYRFDDSTDHFDKAYGRVQGFQQDAALRAAGNALKTGNYDAASGALLDSGNVSGGVQLQRIGAEEASRAATASRADAKAKQDQEIEGLKYVSSFAGRLSDFHARTKDINRTLAAFDQEAPRLQRLAGETPEEIAGIRARLASDPEGTLAAMGAGAKKYQMANGGDGYIGRFDPDTGTLDELRSAQPKPIEMDPTKNYVVPEARSAPAAAGGATDPEAVWRSIVAQESGGDPTPGDAVGPDTRSGNALGSTQMLPATAEAMARKLGIPWNPAFMRENTPRALEYQNRLGRAYFDEGLEKSGGDPAAAAAYYFGGPDPAQHGPKTGVYVDQVMARASGPDAPPAGYRQVQRGQPKAAVRPATAEEKAAYGIAVDVPAKMTADGIQVITGTGAANKRVPAPVQKGYIENNSSIAQIDRAIALVKQHKKSMGVMNVLGDEVRQRTDPDGIKTRASVAEVGAVKIHDLSGAAVTASETPRLKPFIPMPTDGADATIAKLEQLRDHLKSNNSQIETQYGEESGYAPMSRPATKPAAATASPAASKLRSDPGAIRDATIAIRRGAPKDAVIKRLRENGIDPAGI